MRRARGRRDGVAMTNTDTINPAPTHPNAAGELIYRFEARLGDLYPVGVYRDGLRFHNSFEGTITDGLFAGGRIFGLDEFTLRPDGVGVVDAPEIIETTDARLQVRVRGYVVPPTDMQFPGLEVVTSPGFQFPDIDFRFTGAAFIEAVDERYQRFNSVVGVLEGTVNMASGAIKVEARAADGRG
jgi:Protein of unknown function (DUF3237)